MPRDDLEDWLLDISERMDRLTCELSAGGPRLARQRGWEPRIDLFESQDHVLIRAELAGVNATHMKIVYHAERNCVILRGRRADAIPSGSEEKFAAHHLEIETGQFEREIALPDVAIDAHRIRSDFRNGMLILSMPKTVREDSEALVVEKTVVLRKE